MKKRGKERRSSAQGFAQHGAFHEPRVKADRRGEREDRPAKPEKKGAGPAVIFGVLPVLEALRANPRRIEKTLVAEGAREHRLAEIVEISRLNGIQRNTVSRDELGDRSRMGSTTRG